MNCRKFYKSPLIDLVNLDETEIIMVSGGDDFGDWENTNWGTTGGIS